MREGITPKNERNHDKVKTTIIKHNHTNKPNNPVVVDQMYSQKMTVRRNSAKKYRRDMLQENPRWKLYIAYPAKVMYKAADNEDYRIQKQF